MVIRLNLAPPIHGAVLVYTTFYMVIKLSEELYSITYKDASGNFRATMAISPPEVVKYGT